MLNSSVVSLTEITEHIVQITLHDRESKNGFSDAIVGGIMEAFDRIRASDTYRVAILTGYDNYFCTGGTKTGLLTLNEGKQRFSDGALYSKPFECPIPVISAMQGHAVGGGFVFGLYSDFVVLSRECVYTTNFMRFGFTPGFGSTYILREKLGLPLAQEMLTTGRSYRGTELEKRGIPFTVLPKKEVMDYCLELARDVAEKPRLSLIMLKNHMLESYREQLPKYIEKEEAMHDDTFRSNEVTERIEQLYGE